MITNNYSDKEKYNIIASPREVFNRSTIFLIPLNVSNQKSSFYFIKLRSYIELIVILNFKTFYNFTFNPT